MSEAGEIERQYNAARPRAERVSMSELEETLLFHLRAVGLPEPEREAMLVPGRRWRVDFVWRAAGLVVEVEGGVWQGGRHTTGAGFSRDIEKYNSLTLLGYHVLRFTGDMVKDGRAVAVIERALYGTSERAEVPHES
jgi:very-short-patch-repair endonuclease